MEREAKVIAIGSWTGPAYLVDGVWYVRPQSIVETMGMDWVKVRKKLVSMYADDVRLIQKGPGMSRQKPILMTVEATVRWLAAYGGNNKMAGEKRAIAKDMASAMARQFAAMAIESGCPAASDGIVVLGGRHGR